MRVARETFLHFIADNITGGTPVHNIRRDTDNPDLQNIQTNAVNIQFIGDAPQVNVGDLMVTIDVVHEDELKALDIVKGLWTLLSATGYTLQYDYTVPASPVALASNLTWVPDSVRFRPIFNDLYFRYSCLLTLSYHIY